MTEAETMRLAARGAVAGLCPITEANLGDGIFPARYFAGAGGRFGVGSDSNVLIDAAGELRQLEYSQRLAWRARNVMAAPATPSTGRSLFDAACAGGAQACGVPLPSLAPGQPADLVSLAADVLGLASRRHDTLLDSWIFAARDNAVDGVWRQGVRRVSQGRHHDRDAVGRRFRAALAALLS
jgi:cytosine/adenosine deaminase-related metal-dependent hydrolase